MLVYWRVNPLEKYLSAINAGKPWKNCHVGAVPHPNTEQLDPVTDADKPQHTFPHQSSKSVIWGKPMKILQLV